LGISVAPGTEFWSEIQDEHGITTYAIGGTDCWKIGCRHVIIANVTMSFWEVFHYLPGASDHGEAYRRYNFVDYVPTEDCASPFYEAVWAWFKEIHEHMARTAREVRYHR
jgi:hypothetical protein